MATASILDSSDEKSNGFKLTRLIVDGGTEALRKTFTGCRPGNLHTLLSTFQPSLLRLKHRKIINQNQWDKLYPASPNLPNINDFDITLLSVLLRTICGLLPPSLGWDKMPNVSDLSVEADIVRIRIFRNERFGHIPNTSVSTTDFKTFWAEISSPLVRLGIDQKEIDRLENELCGEEEVKRVLKEWNKDENKIMNVLNENRNVLNDINDDVKALVKRDEESRSDAVLNKHLVSFNFKSEIDFHYDRFTEGTRVWVFYQVSTWFNDETSPNRAFIISGLAGMGKSVIAAVICKRFAEDVGASHFFQYNNSRYNNPKFLLQSLAWHLCEVVPAYKEALIEKLSGNLGQQLNDMNSEGLFSILFKEPFSGIADPGKRILIVLDALDETEYNGRDDLGSLISNNFHQLPSFIRFVITTRPEKNLIDQFKELNPLYIEPNDERNMNDVKLVLQKSIPSASAPTADLINSLAEKCGGLMLYAFFLSQIYQDESSTLNIHNLPKGVEKYYKSCFKRLGGEFTGNLNISKEDLFFFLSALAVAKEPLPEAFLLPLFSSKNSKISQFKVREAINSISSFLLIKEDKSISFFHKSIRDCLVDNTEHRYSVDVPDGHQILFGLCVKKLNEFKEGGVRDIAMTSAAVKYSIKYCIVHMLNKPEISGELECFVSDYVTDLEVLFASVCINVDLTLNNITSLTNHKMYNNVSENTRAMVSRLFFLIRKFALFLRDHPETFLQNVVNEGGKDLSLKASTLLTKRYVDITYLEFSEKGSKNDALEAHCLLSGQISGIDISSKHDYVVCSYRQGGIELFSLATGKSEWKIQDIKVKVSFLPSPGVGDGDSDGDSDGDNGIHGSCMLPHCIVFHPCESLIFPGRLDKTLTLQGTFTTGPFQCDEGFSKFTNSCFSLDSSRMVTNYGNDLIIWNISSGKKERCLSCEPLLSFSFAASGNFLGTTDFENVFNVYDITNDYHVRSMQMFPVEIVSTFEQNSWFCCDDQLYIKIVNHDFSPSQDFPRSQMYEVILPSNFYYSQELQCFLQNPKQSLFSKVKKMGLMGFGKLRLSTSSYTALRYILIEDKSVLIYSCNSIVMQVFSKEGLLGIEEQRMHCFFYNISTNGDFVYLYNKSTPGLTVYGLDSKNKCSKPCQNFNQSCFPVVTDGVILIGDNRTPELWNSDLTQCLASFDQLAGTEDCLSVSDELIACVYRSSVTFFNVFTQEIRPSKIFNEYFKRVLACSIKYHVLAKIKSSSVALWKDGTRVDGWEDVVCKNALQRAILSAEFSPKGNRLALSYYGANEIFIFDVVSIKFLAQILIYNYRTSFDILHLKFFDNENLLCSSTYHVLYFINVERGEILTCLDVGDIRAPIAVCRKRSIVFVALRRPELFELIKVWLPRKL